LTPAFQIALITPGIVATTKSVKALQQDIKRLEQSQNKDEAAVATSEKK
jgi:hypothetical protein